MFCLEHFSLKCIIKNVELKVNDPLRDHAVSEQNFLDDAFMQ